nr:MAG TPA: hypothetical protein [Caudoviricetes sp.]
MLDANRCSRSSSTNRYRNSSKQHRHPHSRCCSTEPPHGLWGNPPFLRQM